MPGLSLHVVDVARGTPAHGMKVEIFRDGACIARGELDDEGTLNDPVTAATLRAGTYEIHFHAGAWFAGAPLNLSDPPFLDVVLFRFNIADPEQHYHLPMKITPWGFSLYRGA